MTFPVKLQSIEESDKIESEALQMLLEDNPEEIYSYIKEYDPDAKMANSGRLQGPIVKVSSLDVKDWQVTGYRSYQVKFGGKTTTQYLLQSCSDSAFKTVTRVQNDSGDWEDREITVEGAFIMRANSKLNTLLSSRPKISVDNPATVQIISKGEYNGFPSVKLDLVYSGEFEEDDQLINLSF